MLGGKVVVESGVSLIRCTFPEKHLLSPGKHKERHGLCSVSSLFCPELNSRSFDPVAILLSALPKTPPNPHRRSLSQSLLPLLGVGNCPCLGMKAHDFLLHLPSDEREELCCVPQSWEPTETVTLNLEVTLQGVLRSFTEIANRC